QTVSDVRSGDSEIGQVRGPSDVTGNNDPRVLQAADDAMKVAAAAGYIDVKDAAGAASIEKGVCNIESRCNPSFVHYEGGKFSTYQGPGQLSVDEAKAKLATLKSM